MPRSPLRTLRCDGVGDAGLASLGRGLSQLYDLDLAGCGDLSDAGLELAFRPELSFKFLERLVLRNCTQITNVGLGAVRCLVNLKELDMRNLNLITDEGLLPLVRVPLRKLKIFGCTQLTAMGVCRFWEGRMANYRDD